MGPGVNTRNLDSSAWNVPGGHTCRASRRRPLRPGLLPGQNCRCPCNPAVNVPSKAPSSLAGLFPEQSLLPGTNSILPRPALCTPCSSWGNRNPKVARHFSLHHSAVSGDFSLSCSLSCSRRALHRYHPLSRGASVPLGQKATAPHQLSFQGL